MKRKRNFFILFNAVLFIIESYRKFFILHANALALSNLIKNWLKTKEDYIVFILTTRQTKKTKSSLSKKLYDDMLWFDFRYNDSIDFLRRKLLFVFILRYLFCLKVLFMEKLNYYKFKQTKKHFINSLHIKVNKHFIKPNCLLLT